MNLLICDKDNINYYSLPDSKQDLYNINYVDKNNSNETITLKSFDGVWNVMPNSNIQIFENDIIMDKAPLTDYKSYKIKFKSNNVIVGLISTPSYEKYYDVGLNNIKSINIGGTNDCKIQSSSLWFEPIEATITNDNGTISIEDRSSRKNLYINKIKMAKKKLEFGDIVFIKGLTIIVMNNYIKINLPEELLKITLPKLAIEEVDASKYTEVSETEKNIKLYKDNELFFHTPKVKNTIKEETIKIEPPPEEERQENIPAILTYGSSAILGLTSCVTAIQTIRGIKNGTIDSATGYLELFICLLMVIACTVFPLLVDLWQKK